MSTKDLNDTLETIARTRGTTSVTGGGLLNAMDMLQEIERELAQAIYDEPEKENAK